MSLSTYSDLKTAVASWLNRTDLGSVIPDFIALAEADIRLDLRCQAMETVASGTLTGETLAHPTRYLEARRLVVGDVVYRYVTPDMYSEYEDSGEPMFTSIGTNLYILDGVSGDSYTLTYYAGFAAFSADADTNWLLTNAPDVYLSAACRHGSVYLKDDASERRFALRYADAVSRITRKEHRTAHSGPLMVRAA